MEIDKGQVLSAQEYGQMSVDVFLFWSGKGLLIFYIIFYIILYRIYILYYIYWVREIAQRDGAHASHVRDTSSILRGTSSPQTPPDVSPEHS